MAEELTRTLTTLAERGTPRGAAEVLEDARLDASGRTAAGRPSWRRGLVVAAGTAAIVLVLVGSVALFVRPPGGDEIQPTGAAPPVAATAPVSGGTVHPLNQVEALALAPDGQLWAATSGGVVLWDPITGDPTVFGSEDGVPASAIMAVDVAPDGTVWIAGDGWIGRYDGSWEVFSSQNTPLIDSQIMAMAVDDNGVVWVDVASEPPLRYDGSWTQGLQPPASVWGDASDVVVADDGTRWAAGDAGISGSDGSGTTLLVVSADIATNRRPPIRLTPIPAEDTSLISTTIGDIAFTTMQLPLGHSFFAIAASPYGPVVTDGSILRWSADGLAWEGTIPTVDPWRIMTSGDAVIVYGAGYARYVWDGTAWIEVAAVELPGPARHLAFGPGGVVAVIQEHHGEASLVEDAVYYSADGVDFAKADLGPGREQLPATGSRSCVQSGPSSSSDPPQPRIGPVLATGAGFVLITPAHPANWSRTPICEPLLWFSPEGSRWELVSAQSPFGMRAIVHRIAEHDGRYVAVGATADEPGAVWVSADALNWERADIEMEAAYGVAGGELGWIVTGSTGERDFPAVDVWVSPDGLVWDGPHEGPEALMAFYFLPELAVGTDAIFGATDDIYVVGRVEK